MSRFRHRRGRNDVRTRPRLERLTRVNSIKSGMASLETSTNFIGAQLITNYRAEPRPERAREPTVTPDKQSLVFGGTGYNRLHKQMSILPNVCLFKKRI